MMRFGFTTRLLLIFVASLIALQLLAVMFYFSQRSRATDRGFSLPFPDQVAALVELFETSPPAQRTLLLRAANSAEISVRLEPKSPELQPETWQPSPFVERTLKRYLEVIGEREVTVLLQPSEGSPQRYGGLAMIYPAAARIFVALKTGETLVIETTGVLSIRIFGWPPGFWAGLLGFLIAILVFFSVRAEAKPLRELARAVDRVDLDGKADPIPDRPKGAPEIRALIAAFNRMRDRLAFLMKSRLALIGGISHDLRTYATRLRLRAELIPDDEERSRAIRDIEDMMQLLDDSLLAVEANGRADVGHELVDVADILAQEIADLRAAGQPVALTNRRRGDAVVLGHSLALKRVLVNVIDNAIKYGERADISLDVADATVVITVDDRGRGIPADQRAAVLEPFVRLEGSRNRRTGGAGLGLAIAHAAVQAHGGTLELGDAEPRGTRVRITLPRFVAKRAAE